MTNLAAPLLTPQEQAIIHEELQILANIQSGMMLHLLPPQRKDYYRDVIELRDSLMEVRAEDMPAIVAHMERMVLLAHQQEKVKVELPINRRNPYFAHIRLCENGRTRDLLIGNHNWLSEHVRYPIIDWKNAPISRIFYRYQEGDEYEEEIGERVIEGTLLVRRVLSFDQGELKRISTRQATLVHREDGWHKLQSTTSQLKGGGGLVLRSVSPSGMGASQRTQRTDKHLQEITALIDPQQFEIITQPESGVVVIQGGAGSGKTTIALHRLAYLVALQPHYFAPPQLLTMVFNKALARYISKVLPSLGVEGVPDWVYQEWVSQLRLRFVPGLPGHYSEQTPVAAIELKRHPAMLRYLQEAVQAREAEFDQRLWLELENFSEQESVWNAWKSLATEPLAWRLLEFFRWSQGKAELPRIPSCRNYVLKMRLGKIIEEMFPELEETPTSLATHLWEECFLHEDRLRQAFERLAPGAFSLQQIKDTWEWAVKNYELRHRLNADQGKIEHEEPENPPPPKPAAVDEPYRDWEEETSESPRHFGEDHEKLYLDEEDDTLLLLLYQMTLGPFRGKKHKILTYPHILVDEAQDFSPLELQLLISMTPPQRRSVTLAGDFDQKIMLGAQVGNWAEMIECLGLDTASVAPLKIGYRSTFEIMELAKALIGPISVNQEWHATRHGAAVELFRFQDHGEMVGFLAEALLNLSNTEHNANVAVLSRYPAQANLVYEGLNKADIPRLRRVKDQDFSFAPGIEVSDIAQVKGLEFDYVILVDVDQATFPDDHKSRHLLYVGVTRAAHQLWLMTCGRPSPLLPMSCVIDHPLHEV